METSKILEIFNIEDTAERCKRVLDEIQPELQKILKKFIGQYQEEIPELTKYKVHTHENTLQTTYYDALSPKYAEKKRNTKIGKDTFVTLVDDFGFHILKFRLDAKELVFRVTLDTSFYPLCIGYKERKLETILAELDEEIKFNTYYDENRKIAKHDLLKDIEIYYQSKKTPELVIGIDIPLEGTLEEEYLIKKTLEAWHMLRPLREFLQEQGQIQSKARKVLNMLKATTGSFTINIHKASYELNLHEATKNKSGQYKQDYTISENQQMIVKGRIDYYLNHYRNPYEYIGVNVKDANQIYTSIRQLVLEDRVEWVLSKKFAMKDVNNSELLENALKLLVDEGFKVDGNKYYIGTYDSNLEEFDKPIETIIQQLIKSAIIFAQVRGDINLVNDKETKNLKTDEEEVVEEIQDLKWNFDLLQINEIIHESGFSFSKQVIRDFHLNLTALEDKHFVILSGISGTGKTQLCSLYANAVYGLSYEEENPYMKIIPVRPDWMDSTPLFGYYSVYEERYVRTEFLNFLLSAIESSRKPHFVVLDEMNLARVEYYLSDYLSAVESGKKIRLHTVEGLDIPQEVEIPPNLYVIGTINVDETTHSISDKVLDRAFVMRLSDVDFDTYWDKEEKNIKDSLNEEFKMLVEIHKLLVPMDMHFGYRVMKEILKKLYKNKSLPEDYAMDKKEAIDSAVCEKVLPKVRGDEKIIPLIEDLLRWCIENLGENTKTVQHLRRMEGELERYGATQFWN